MIKKIHILFLIATFAICAQAQKVQVEQKLGAVQIMMGDTTSYTLSVTAPKGAKVVFPEYKKSLDEGNPLSPWQPLIEVTELLSGDTTTLDDGYVRTTMKYAITSFEPNVYTIDSVIVSVNGQPYCGNKLALKVLEVQVDTTDTKKMCGPKGIMDNEFEWSEWLPIILALILIALLAAVIVWLFYRKSKGKPIRLRFRTIKHIPPHERAIAEINTIKKEQLAIKEDNKAYYTRLTDTLRKYMEERFGFSAMEMTTSEIIEHLSKEQNKEKVDELRILFETADLVKFAKHQALINENDRNLVAAMDFVNSTKKVEDKATVKKEQEKLSAEEEKTRKTNIVLITLIIIAGAAALTLLVLAVWRIIELLE